MATSWHVWPECTIMKDRFWKMANENRSKVQIPFEQSFDSFGESTTPEHKTPFIDYNEGEGTFIDPRLILE